MIQLPDHMAGCVVFCEYVEHLPLGLVRAEVFDRVHPWLLPLRLVREQVFGLVWRIHP